MRVVVETMVTRKDPTGLPVDVGWRTDSVSSRYWAGRRWAELTGREEVARLVDTRGDLVKYGA